MRRQFIFSTIVILLLSMNATMSAFAQNQYQYEYDSSGNRVKRTIVLGRSSVQKSTQSLQKEVIKDSFGTREIKIYPNPTKGNLTVQIPLSEDQEPTSLRIYNMKGVLIINQLVESENTLLNLGKQPSGFYIMRIISGKSVSEWKISKQ
jgi:hypothetical protein